MAADDSAMGMDFAAMSFIPVTPAGTLVVGLAADTREEAIRRLLHDAAHMPYGTWKNFQKRGYTIERVPEIAAENPPLWCGHGLVAPYPDAGPQP